MIDSLFPPEVITTETSVAECDGALLPEEEPCVARAFPRRRREFTAGRVCARKALASLGIRNFPLVAAHDRLPVWPDGIIGSISHCRDYCGVAVARKGRILGLGLDVERPGPLEKSLITRICTETELTRLDTSFRSPGDWAKIIFSAKESTYKCTYPLHRIVLGFHDVQIAFEEPGNFTATMLKASESLGGATELPGRYATTEKFVFTGVTFTTEEAA